MTVAVAQRAPRSFVRRYGPLALAGAATAFVLAMVPFRDRCTADGCEAGLLSTLRTVRLDLLAAAFVCFMASTLVWSSRWRALLGLAGVRFSLREVWRITLEAQAGAVLFPGGLGGDALRIAYTRERAEQSSLPKIVASLFADRIIGLVTLATLALGAGALFDSAALGPVLWLLAAIPALALLLVVVLRMPALARMAWLETPLARRVVAPTLEYVKDPKGLAVLLRGLLLSFVVSALQLVVIRLLIAALGGAPQAEGWVYVGTTFGMMVAALPLTPGAWGTADAAYVVFLGHAGVTPQVAAAVCMLYRVFWYACAVIGAGFTIGRRK